jgi:signal peptidase I
VTLKVYSRSRRLTRTPARPNGQQRPAPSGRSGLRHGHNAIRIVGLTLGLLAAVLLTTLLGNRRVVVRGVSMRPLLNEGERVLVNPLAYRLGRPRRGDVALVRGLPGAGPDLLLKRIVGLPGETITLRRDRLHVDGRVLDLGRPVIGSSPGQWALGPDDYFLLSENLAIGTDSRHTGPVRRSDLLGRAWLVYVPSVRRVASGESGSSLLTTRNS